jgi:hypothetical protein
MFSERDLQQMKERGSSPEVVGKQILNFKKGFPYINLIKPALVKEGIVRLSDEETENYSSSYIKNLGNKAVVKFVPASGAATRMFKDLFAFMGEFDGSEEAIEKLEQKKGPMFTFFERIRDFAFYEDLKAVMSNEGHELEKELDKKNYVNILSYLLTEKGLGYGELPKGLLKFHCYENETRTPAEEHLVEGANYAVDNTSVVRIHMTVSPDHREKFEKHISSVKGNYEQEFGVNYNVSFSEQKASTDTIAVDIENNPFRNEDDSLLFRPAGHGALIENLNDLDADIIFIKNIDNVVPDQLKDTTYLYKKAIGGILIEYQNKVFNYLNELEKGNIGEELLNEILEFIEKDLSVRPSGDFQLKSKNDKVEILRRILNRPIRVCGMVKNEGEAGGGPFWAKNFDHSVSLQIVETSQINMDIPEQKAILESSTHFNPVDIVCGVKDYKGKKFELLKFIDPDTGFITKKSKDGKDLKAQELPGLWNGSMSDWNTIFVEVPIITFNPVKSVNDLLRKEHQPASQLT